jgi:hypothetical protein
MTPETVKPQASAVPWKQCRTSPNPLQISEKKKEAGKKDAHFVSSQFDRRMRVRLFSHMLTAVYFSLLFFIAAQGFPHSAL